MPAQRSGFPLEHKSILNFDFSEHKAKALFITVDLLSFQ